MTRDKLGEISDNPAADNAVVGGYNNRHKRGQPAQEAETLVKLFVCADAGEPCFSAYGNLGDHQRKAEGYRKNNVDKQEYAAAVFCRKIGEAPKVSESDRRACCRQNETDAPGEAASFFVHFKRSLIPLDFFVESTLIY